MRKRYVNQIVSEKFELRKSMKRLPALISLLLSIVYVGLGTVRLMSYIHGTGYVFSTLGDNFENGLWPAYFLGFAFGYGGGNTGVLLGQLITLGLAYFLFYYSLQLIQWIISKLTSKLLI